MRQNEVSERREEKKKVVEILSTFELEALVSLFCICYNKVYNLGISRGRKK